MKIVLSSNTIHSSSKTHTVNKFIEYNYYNIYYVEKFFILYSHLIRNIKI